MRVSIFCLALLLISNQSSALTCIVQNYTDLSVILNKKISTSNEFLLEENGYRYKVLLLKDQRYGLFMLDSKNSAIAAMGLQGYELTLANENLNRIITCR